MSVFSSEWSYFIRYFFNFRIQPLQMVKFKQFKTLNILSIQLIHQNKSYLEDRASSSFLTQAFFWLKQLQKGLILSFNNYKGRFNKQKTINTYCRDRPMLNLYNLSPEYTMSGICVGKIAFQFIIISQGQNKSPKMNYTINISQITQNAQKLQVFEQQPSSLQPKIIKKHLKSIKKSKVKISSFSWNRAQERKYVSFLKVNGRLFSLTPKQRKQIKINVMMSYAIKSRTSSQCHSHHQKLLIRYGTIQGIIQHHGFLYSKQYKGEVENKQIEANESIAESNQNNQANYQLVGESFFQLEDKKEEEPIWWGYLDAYESNHEPTWNNVNFFSQ